jgi:YesN/AraC family two-component response regulator
VSPDLVVYDIKMPGTDGIKAMAEASRACPVPTILVSAYSDPELLASGQQA